MFTFLTQIDMSIFFQSILFVLFLILLFRMSWKLGSIVLLSFNIFKYLLFILIFTYLFSNWASDVNPTLRNSSVVIISLINLYMLWQVIVTSFELSYQRALRSCVGGICTPLDIKRSFITGRRYYYIHYFWQSFASGTLPWIFLSGIAAERTRDDLHRAFMNADSQTSIFNSNLFIAFLRSKLEQDTSLSLDSKADQQRGIDQMEQNGWIRQQSDTFLHLLITAPELLLETGMKEALTKDLPGS